MLEVGRVGGVLLPVPGRLARVEPVGVGAVGVEGRGRVEERVDQRQRGDPLGPPQCGHQGQVAAGAVAWSSSGPARSGLLVDPVERGVDVLDRRREAVLRRAPVVDAEHPQTRSVGQPPGVHVLDVGDVLAVGRGGFGAGLSPRGEDVEPGVEEWAA